MMNRIGRSTTRITRNSIKSTTAVNRLPIIISNRFALTSNSNSTTTSKLLGQCQCFSSSPINLSSSTPTYTIGELDTKEYQRVSDRAMDRLTEYMEELMEETAGLPGGENFDVEYSSGVLTMKVTDTVTYVINKQPPNKQIWLASPISGPKRYDYDTKHKVWFYHRDNSLMRDLLNQELKVLMNNESVDVDLGEEDNE